ncbi:MAG: hypothetical protein MZU84_01845 [Sphingobacterium sp.]|nr:hypothetical protein [Sphingobacterium sp.]
MTAVGSAVRGPDRVTLTSGQGFALFVDDPAVGPGLRPELAPTGIGIRRSGEGGDEHGFLQWSLLR